jgi:hypothetical protein
MLHRSLITTTRSTIRSYSSVIRNFKIPPSSTSIQKKTNLLGLTLEDLQQELAGLQHSKKFTPLQIWQHMYKKGYTQFDEMPNLSKDLQQELSAKYEINYGEVKVGFSIFCLFITRLFNAFFFFQSSIKLLLTAQESF